jgi:L-alanine-DL-glutamate epimerase-like enolase superfamily enzyme
VEISYCKYSLKFKHPFGLSYGTRLTTEVVFIRLECEGLYGYGEASLPPYLGETQDSVINFLRTCEPLILSQNSSFSLADLIGRIDRVEAGNNAAKAGLDIALHDLKGKLDNKSVYELYSISKPLPKSTSATISIGDLSSISQKIEEQNNFSVLKIKLGTENDREIVETIRSYTDKKLVLDVNQGWRDKSYALEMINWLCDKNILFLEQPLPKEDLSGAEWISDRSEIPIIADEAFRRLEDLDKIKNAYHGINIKLMKCTGLYEAIKIIEAARKSNLKINLGCMTESSCAVAAAAQLLSLVDWVDLDGPLLINNDPFEGINYSSGQVQPINGSGTGVDLKADLSLQYIPL